MTRSPLERFDEWVANHPVEMAKLKERAAVIGKMSPGIFDKKIADLRWWLGEGNGKTKAVKYRAWRVFITRNLFRDNRYSTRKSPDSVRRASGQTEMPQV